ncbi:MAG: YkgJ family cysteine cluster protein [Phycisphaerales bacterium]|nr:YkgJ family cysteine cluster protein [Phycisphaerales bacterium]
MPDAQRNEWYADGLAFECTCCGACCSGPTGYVAFTREEAAAIARRLGVTLEAFVRDYTRDTASGRSLNEVETEHGHDCVFLDRATIPGKAVCSIYEDRPKQCRTFPWWPENIASPRAWQRLGRSCEGVGRGAVVPVEEIRISRDKQRARG